MRQMQRWSINMQNLRIVLLLVCMPFFMVLLYVSDGGGSFTIIISKDLLENITITTDRSDQILTEPVEPLHGISGDEHESKDDVELEQNNPPETLVLSTSEISRGLKTQTHVIPDTDAASLLDGHVVSLLDSPLVPLRGPGDSHLPFEQDDTPKIDSLPEDWFEEEKPRDLNRTAEEDNPPLKKILFWNEVFGNKSFYFGFGQKPFLLAGCRINTCVTTGNRHRFLPEEIDAVIWHVRSDDRSLPSKRSPHTRYVFWSLESPPHMGTDISLFNNIFNWTFTYRLDSDFPNPYDVIYRRPKPGPIQIDKNYATEKTKLVAWFVSNCHTSSGRERFVKTLQRWMKIDIYGECGPLKCSRKSQQDFCLRMLERDYKFYLSFENSLCNDYATEKIFEILQFDVVPVVYGLGNYTTQLPPHSYIDALDFSSAKDLADYLLYLHGNDTAYNQYFRWKPYHNIPPEWTRMAKPWCDLCERLHNDQSQKISDLEQWFIRESYCIDYKTPGINRFINGLPLSGPNTPES